MRQIDYNLILACIHHGAAAVEKELAEALNQEIETANKYRDEHKEPKEQKVDEKKETK